MSVLMVFLLWGGILSFDCCGHFYTRRHSSGNLIDYSPHTGTGISQDLTVIIRGAVVKIIQFHLWRKKFQGIPGNE